MTTSLSKLHTLLGYNIFVITLFLDNHFHALVLIEVQTMSNMSNVMMTSIKDDLLHKKLKDYVGVDA